MELFTLVPIFVGLVFVLVIGGIIFAIVKGIGTWAWNNEQPIQTVPARVVSKRTSTSGGGATMNSGGGAIMDSGGSVSTWYYVTFEMENGDRQEWGLAGREYGLLVEGDSGMLTFQGTRYKGFARSR
jgi:hypothetical protein